MAKKKEIKSRADNYAKEERVLKVAKLILEGYSKRSFLIHKITDLYSGWKVSERQLDNYIRDAKEMIKNSYSEEDLVLEKDIASNRLEALFTMNMKIQDYREARNVTMDRARLLGLLVEKSEVKHSGDINIEI